MMASRHGNRLAFYLLLAPVVLWLGLLIVLPHVEMLTISLRERVSSQVYRFSLKHYEAFFIEPLYWITFARTAFYERRSGTEIGAFRGHLCAEH